MNRETSPLIRNGEYASCAKKKQYLALPGSEYEDTDRHIDDVQCKLRFVECRLVVVVVLVPWTLRVGEPIPACGLCLPYENGSDSQIIW